MNPFVLASEELVVPAPSERVLADLEELIAGGFESEGRHYRVFGGRVGSRFSLSLGMPILGGGAPVLRGRARGDAMTTTLALAVGARYELIALVGFWWLITVFGGGYQLWLQARRALAGEAGWGAVTEVLPGIAILGSLSIAGLVLWRRRNLRAARALIDVVHQFVFTADPAEPGAGAASPVPPPIH